MNPFVGCGNAAGLQKREWDLLIPRKYVCEGLGSSDIWVDVYSLAEGEEDGEFDGDD